LVEMSRKFTVGDINFLANESGFVIDKTWRDQTWGMQMLVPFKEAFVRCWNTTDAFFENLPNWTEKPIDIRHPFCFYYGHMSAFAKLKLLPNELPTKLDLMFSRGIDPMVTDPSKCHSHPEVPVQWPTKEEIIEYVHHVRLLLTNAMEDKDCISAHLINMGLEHEYMHLETLTYMLVQQQKKRFEKKKSSNGFNTLSYTNGHINNSHVGNGGGSTSTSSGPTTKPSLTPMISYPSSGTMVQISKGNVTMGGNVADDAFMWDNEYPQLTTFVLDTFVVSSEPVTVREFLAFVKEGGYEHEELWHPVDFKFFKEQGHKHPATWSKVQDEYYVHCPNLTTHHWSKVADQPVLVSLSEAEAFCSSVGCRVMTEAEYHKILQSGGYAPKVHKLRTDGWEWTSSPFQPFPGFKPMDEYPEYSSDFFDGSHYVLKGASSVTHPIMQRDSLRNFYQRQYPYVFAKFRCCKSM
jgi:formylglycine-generating enzyme required for sulfatase activity